MSPKRLPKVFGIGLNKTGTSSLTAALGVLGYRAFHNSLPGLREARISARVDDAIDNGRPPLHHLWRMRRYDAFFDVRAVERHFEHFDTAYPGAKFILHTRELGSWLDSREKHVKRNIERGIVTWTSVDRAGWEVERAEQHARVRAHFADRPADLLELDVIASPGWSPLVEFLGVSTPAIDFPHANRADSATNGLGTRARRALRSS